jgi:polyferredoxin
MRRPKISEWRLAVQTAWLFVLTSTLFGIPYFSEVAFAKNIFWPNLSTRFLVYNPTTSFLYQIQSRLSSGYETYYVNIIIPLVIFLFLVTLLGRVWCGWLCPIGYLQNILLRIRKALGIPYTDISPKATMVLNQSSLVILFLISFLSFSVGVTFLGINSFFSASQLPFETVAPPRPITVFIQQLIGWESWDAGIPLPAIFVVLTVIVLSFKIRHFWCRICPAGAMMSFVNRSALVTIQKDGTKCTKCRACLRACPMDIEEIYEEKERANVTNRTCIHCYRCIELCPEDGCLSVTFLNRKITKSKFPYSKKVKGVAK